MKTPLRLSFQCYPRLHQWAVFYPWFSWSKVSLSSLGCIPDWLTFDELATELHHQMRLRKIRKLNWYFHIGFNLIFNLNEVGLMVFRFKYLSLQQFDQLSFIGNINEEFVTICYSYSRWNLTQRFRASNHWLQHCFSHKFLQMHSLWCDLLLHHPQTTHLKCLNTSRFSPTHSSFLFHMPC